MTKKVRIENADPSPSKVVVEVFEKSSVDGEPDRSVQVIILDHPAAMCPVHIHSHRYVIVKEVLDA